MLAYVSKALAEAVLKYHPFPFPESHTRLTCNHGYICFQCNKHPIVSSIPCDMARRDYGLSRGELISIPRFKGIGCLVNDVSKILAGPRKRRNIQKGVKRDSYIVYLAKERFRVSKRRLEAAEHNTHSNPNMRARVREKTFKRAKQKLQYLESV